MFPFGIADCERHIVYWDLWISPPGMLSRQYRVVTDVLFENGEFERLEDSDAA